jgi:hypothetical protein
MLHDELQMVQCNACLHFYPHTPKEGYEGRNHIAISQRALLYLYLPHKSGYDFLHMHKNMRMQMQDCNAWTSYTK